MSTSRIFISVTCLLVCIITAGAIDRSSVVADALTRTPLPYASVFNHKGTFIGMSGTDGTIRCASASDYPITIRYIGYNEGSAQSEADSLILLEENVTDLSEIVVEAKRKKVLHILAYVREYSTLSSFSDTITMFREKIVDFMQPTDDKGKFKGWRYPRILKTRSYYHFANSNGLDSVSDRCSHHFTWSDWVGIAPSSSIPDAIASVENGADTICGKYSPTEIWMKNGDKLSLDINVMADTASRKWVPNISYFFNQDDTDFEQFRLKLNYDNISGDVIGPRDLTGYSFNIKSNGRGRGMFQFEHNNQPGYVTTYAEVYIIDKNYISVREAKKWQHHDFYADKVDFHEPKQTPALDATTLALIERVNNIDTDHVRLQFTPDQRLKSPYVSKNNYSMGRRAVSMLKQLTGITAYKTRKLYKTPKFNIPASKKDDQDSAPATK